MIFFGCPIGFRHIPYIAGDQVRRIKHWLRPKPAARIHFVYFSCARDMPLLTLSLRSLRCLNQDRMGSIFVVVDSKDPFSVSQQSDLKNIVQNLEFLMLGQIDWASIQTLQTELKAFGIAASQAMPTDYIAKVDSDVLFFSEDKIAEVCVCGSDFVGDGHYSSYAYAQGGLYFLRASLAIELSISVSVAELEQMILQCHSRSEDVVMSSLVRKHTDSIWLTRLMLFPDEFSKTNLNRRWVKQEFSALHFVHRKADMPRYADRLKLI